MELNWKKTTEFPQWSPSLTLRRQPTSTNDSHYKHLESNQNFSFLRNNIPTNRCSRNPAIAAELAAPVPIASFRAPEANHGYLPDDYLQLKNTVQQTCRNLLKNQTSKLDQLSFEDSQKENINWAKIDLSVPEFWRQQEQNLVKQHHSSGNFKMKLRKSEISLSSSTAAVENGINCLQYIEPTQQKIGSIWKTSRAEFHQIQVATTKNNKIFNGKLHCKSFSMGHCVSSNCHAWAGKLAESNHIYPSVRQKASLNLIPRSNFTCSVEYSRRWTYELVTKMVPPKVFPQFTQE